MAGGWITIFTLKIDFETQTFTPSSKRKPGSSNFAKARCTCSRLDQIHPHARLFDLKRGLFPSRNFRAHFVFTAPGKLDEAEQLCEADQDRKHSNLSAFCLWMLSLAAQLSDLCDSDHSSGYNRVEQSFDIRPFQEGRILKKNVCKQVSEVLQSPLHPSEAEAHGMGYVYVLRAQICSSTLAELKIGFSKHHPEHRSHELASCLARPEVICHTPLLPHAKRLESIIHAELHACRKVQSCHKCDRNHQEWFTISHADAREVVTRWGKWILKQPYVDGQLTADWKAHLAKEDFGLVKDNTSLSDFWETWINKLTVQCTRDKESQRIGGYLNNCYWDFTMAQCGVGLYGKDVCDSIRADMPRGRNNRGLNYEDMMGSLRELSRAYQELSKPGDQSKNTRVDEILIDAFGSPETPTLSFNQAMPISEIFRKDSRFASMFHSETKWHHLMTVNKSPGTLLRLIKRAMEYEKSNQDEIPRAIESVQNVKTGVISVSHPVLGVTESPLGDATLLPVLALKDLKYLNGNVSNWVGMNPTNAGSQLLQEAYQEGKWVGSVPEFRLPRAFRKAGITRLPTQGEHTILTEKKTAPNKADSSTESAPIDINMGRFIQGPDGDTYQATITLSKDQEKLLEEKLGLGSMNGATDEQLQQLNSRMKELLASGELEWLQKVGARSIEKLGFGLTFDDLFSDGDLDSDSDIPSWDSDIEDEDDICAKTAGCVPPSEGSKKRAAASGFLAEGISRKKAKLWLESL